MDSIIHFKIGKVANRHTTQVSANILSQQTQQFVRMAVSSTMAATTPCITPQAKELLPSIIFKPKNGTLCFKGNNNTITNYTRIRRSFSRFQFQIRSLAEDVASSSSSSSATATDEEGWTESESSPTEVAKGLPSLITPLNVQKALRGIAITDADYYGTLGLRIGCTYDQVRVAYQNKVNELSSERLDEEELNKKLELLKESYTILSSEEERRLYDWSLARNERPDRYTWPFEADITQTSDYGTPPAQEPEDVGPTRVVGYFLLGWLVLAFTLSIALNR